MRKQRGNSSGCFGHILTFLTTLIFLVGCLIIGFVAWILSTSVSIQKFQSGTLILTYIVIGIGFSLFITGLIGFVAGASETPCIIRMFIAMIIVSLFSTVGGVLTLQFARIELDDILRFGWMEVNQSTRNFIQKTLSCCGFRGPREFADYSYHLDPSCYEIFQGERRLKQASCSVELQDWLDTNKSTWVTFAVSLFLVQFLSVIIASFSLYYLNKKNKSRRNASRSSSNRHLYEGSDGTSETFRDSL